MIACLISYRLLQLLTGQSIIVNEDKIQYNIGIFVLLYSLHFITSHHRLTVIINFPRDKQCQCLCKLEYR